MNDLRVVSDEAVRIPSDGITLAGRFTVLSPTAPAVILCHGFAGDKDEKGLFVAARDFLAGHGFSVLRFDFRGCGESEGDFRTVSLDDLASDVSNAVKYLRSCKHVAPNAIGLVGFSLAAGVALLANPRKVNAYVFWSPAIYTSRDMAPRYQTPDMLRDIGRYGCFKKSGLQVGKEFFDELNSPRIELAVPSFHRSVLIIHGTDDQRIPFTSSNKLMQHLPKSSKIALIPGADHSFRSSAIHKEWLLSATVAWLRERFSRVPARSRQKGCRRSAPDYHNPLLWSEAV